MLLQRRDATVTVVHSRTPNGQEICSKADIVIAALGKPEMITGDWIKPGAVVIDVGINAVDVSPSPAVCSCSCLYVRQLAKARSCSKHTILPHLACSANGI